MGSRKIYFILGCLCAIATLFSGCVHSSASPVPTLEVESEIVDNKFVTVENGKFMLHGKPYYYVGANFWQGMNMGMQAPEGDRERLMQELDDLKSLGVTNLRVMASSEGPNTEPYRISPALMIEPGVYDEAVFDGLDFLLAEMGKRDMRAVMVLNNYWQWSGGMGQYVSWSRGTPIPYPGDWNSFMQYVSMFYDCDECQQWYRGHIETVINRENSYTGLKYRDDPAIFSWELANEPRRYPDKWVDETAAYIKSLDPNHMVTTGSEGSPPGESQNFLLTHDGADIDYLTIHVWPQNWGWYDPENPSTYNGAVARSLDYLRLHAVSSANLNKPLVLEEFGLARDGETGNIHDPDSPASYRNLFYKDMFGEVEALNEKGVFIGGDNFWSWAGEARPGSPWIGDPPHEPAGWYSVYNTDFETLGIISNHAAYMKSLMGE